METRIIKEKPTLNKINYEHVLIVFGKKSYNFRRVHKKNTDTVKNQNQNNPC